MGADNAFPVVGAQGRCLRTFPGGTATVAGAILIIAAALKTWQPSRYPLSVPGLQISAESGPALIAFEIFLGLWLISGALPAVPRKIATGCFSIFACYTLYEALAGKTDCGCFGQVHASPWFTFILDVAIVLALVIFSMSGGDNTAPSRWSQRKWPVAAAAGIGLAVGVAAAALHPNPVIVANGLATADSGKLVILEPHKWLGHRLPVLADIVSIGPSGPRAAGRREMSLGQRLATGNWIIMFYHASCGECRATIPVYEELAQQETLSGKRAHVAFVRVPSGSGASTRDLFHSDIPLHATLDASHQWFATTPIVVELRDGIVHRVATGRSAMNWQWMNTAVHHRETTGGIDTVQ
ncbi:MAG: MauE/DoxX family redox-associated membrane protein [Phycisphaerae bacterium]